MRELSNGERATIGAELMAEIYRDKILTQPANASGDGNRALSQGLLFRECVGVVDGVLDYLETATAREYATALVRMVSSAERLGLGQYCWEATLDWLAQRVEDATAEEEAR